MWLTNRIDIPDYYYQTRNTHNSCPLLTEAVGALGAHCPLAVAFFPRISGAFGTLGRGRRTRSSLGRRGRVSPNLGLGPSG